MSSKSLEPFTWNLLSKSNLFFKFVEANFSGVYILAKKYNYYVWCTFDQNKVSSLDTRVNKTCKGYVSGERAAY